jgi:hypothetical protein
VIRLRLALILLMAVLADARLGAAEDAGQAGWTEQQFEFALGGTSLLKASVTPAVFDHASVRAELRRVGVTGACPAVRDAVDAALTAHEAKYRDWAIATLREIITPEEEAGPSGSIAPAGYHASLGRRLMVRMRRERPELLPQVTNDALVSAQEALSALSNTDGDWRGRFADWDFEKAPLTYRIACMIQNSGDPDNGKLAFDGFYQNRGS